MRNKTLILILIGLNLLGILSYFTLIEDEIIEYLTSEPTSSLSNIIELLFPKLLVEKNHFSVDFFLSRVHQILFRTSLANLLVCYIIYRKETITPIWNSYWDTKYRNTDIQIYLIILYSFLAYTLYDWSTDLTHLYRLSDFYKPVLLYHLIPPFILNKGIQLSFIVIEAISLVMLFWNKTRKYSAIIISFIFILEYGLFACFGKVDHGYITIIYSLLVLPILLWNIKKHQWVITLIQSAIALSYFQAGSEKILLSGLSWLNPTHFQQFLLMHPTPISSWIASSLTLCFILSFLTLCFQLTFPIILFVKKLTPIYLISAILFHIGTTFVLDINSYLNPWIISLTVFYPTIAARYKTMPEKEAT